MDRRHFLFFLCILSTTLLINQYFSPSVDSLEKEHQKRLLQVELREKEKTAPIAFSDLPFTKVLSKKQEEKPFFAVDIGGCLLTLAHKPHMPKEVLSNGKALEIAFSNPTIEPVVYRAKNAFLPIKKYAPSSSTLYLAVDQGEKAPEIAFASQEKDALITSRKVEKDALAFDEQKRLVGVYDASTHTIRSFDAYFRLANFIEVEDAPKENYYVLENPYQMLVFSSKGGALAEINLPFESKENSNSVIKKLEIDRKMEKNHPDNDRFPSQSYLSVDGGKTVENAPLLGGYYPLLRRDVYKQNGQKVDLLSPNYYCSTITGDGAENATYQVTRFEENLIEFQLVQSRRTITKRYRFPENPEKFPYVFFLDIEITGDTTGLFLQSGIPEVELISGYFSPELKYLLERGTRAKVEKLSLPSASNPTTPNVQDIENSWVVNSNGFLGVILNPLDTVSSEIQTAAIPGSKAPTRLSLIDAKYNMYPAKNYPGYLMSLPISPKSASSYRIFAGPFANHVLQTIDQNTVQSGKKDPYYTKARSFHGWFSFISAPFAQFLFVLMGFFHKVTHSWGLSIILLTLTVRVLLYPLNAWSLKSQKRMREINPEIKKLQERYKKDPQKMQMEMLKLYKEKGANPFMGCFPVFIQLPFLIGMFDLLKSTFALRGAVFIPGWINNLAAPDVVFSWNYPLFFIGNSLHILPFFLGFAMFLQQKLSAQMTGSKDMPMTEQQKQQQSMGNIMLVMFTLFFYHAPSGLNIYWLFSTLFGLGQQYLTDRLARSAAPKITK